MFGSNGQVGWTDEKLVSGPGVILGRKGAYRGIRYCRDDFFVIDTAYFLSPKHQMDMRWLFYAAQHARLGEIDDGSPIPSTTRSAVYVRELVVPPLDVQREIARILGALDDKIDLNRRMNETLEAMARAIFQDWFVEFGPTRAKMEGREPYLAPEVWSLFPQNIDRELPSDWKREALLGLCELKRGYDLPTAQRRVGSVPIISSSGISGFHDTAMADGPVVATGRYGTIGQVFFIEEPCWPLNTALFVNEFKGNSRRFVYHTICGLDFSIYSDKGAVPGINRNHLHAATVTIPPVDVQYAFERALEPAWTRIRHNEAENKTLASLRDLLLPRLLAGQLRIRDAEALVEAAT